MSHGFKAGNNLRAYCCLSKYRTKNRERIQEFHAGDKEKIIVSDNDHFYRTSYSDDLIIYAYNSWDHLISPIQADHDVLNPTCVMSPDQLNMEKLHHTCCVVKWVLSLA